MQTDAIHKFLDAGLRGLADSNFLINHTSFGGTVYDFVMKCFVFFMTQLSEETNCFLVILLKAGLL